MPRSRPQGRETLAILLNVKPLLTLLPALLLALPLAAEPPPPPKTPAPIVESSEVEVNDPKLKADIDDAIQRGVAWLKARQLPSGAWPGLILGPLYPGATGKAYDPVPELTSLSLLALLKCGVPVNDSCISKGFAWLQKQEFGVTGGYGPAIALLAIEAKYTSKEALAKPGQKATKPKPITPSDTDFKWATKLTNQLLAGQAKIGGWRYGNIPTDMVGNKPGYSDVSCTQYALMGLKTAKRLGIPVKQEAFAKAADFLLGQQEADGKPWIRITLRQEGVKDDSASGYADKARGFPYMKGAANQFETIPTGAMTCAGLVGILICRSEILEQKDFPDRAKRLPKVDQAMWDALAWLDQNWSTAQNPSEAALRQPEAGMHELGYYLYGLERVGVMADLRMIGPKHDWYIQGAKTWIDRLDKNPADITKTLGAKADAKEVAGMGYWGFSHSRQPPETQDTPYGLLFLRKASIRLGYSIDDAGK